MKDYKTVVRERYDRQKYDGDNIPNNIYAPINTIVFYGDLKTNQILYEFVNMLYSRKKNLHKISICDCGAGTEIKQDLWQNYWDPPAKCLAWSIQKIG